MTPVHIEIMDRSFLLVRVGGFAGRPFYMFTSIQELIHVAKSGKLTAAFAKGRRPETEGWHFFKITIPIEDLKTRSADEIREFVHERLISELPPGYHAENCESKKDAPSGAPWAGDEATAT